VDCPYAAHLSREYVLLIDPPRAAEPDAPPVRVAQAAEAEPAAVPAPAPAAAPVRRAAPRGPAIASGTTYRVRPGDTLSGIAARLSGRRIGLWPTVERLFEANPHAFIDGNPDRLRAGAVLQIPGEVYAGTAAAEPPAPARALVEEPEPAGATAYAGYAPGAATAAAPES